MVKVNAFEKISDFGLSSILKTNDSNCSDTCGTLNYMAPEIIQNLSYCGYKADVWSLGIILYECIFGVRPFDDQDVQNLMKKILSAHIIVPGSASNHLKGCSIIKDLL